MRKLIKHITVALLAVAGLASCTGDYAQPPVPVPPGGIGTGAWDNPMSVYQASLGAVNENLIENPWVSGYIVGWIDVDVSNVMNELSTRFTVPATVATNMVMASTPDETDWTKCISVQLPSGSVRNALNLKDHPENLHAFVTIQGTTGSKYCSVYGVRSVSAYTWDKVGIEPEKPLPPAVFRKTAKVVSGHKYLLVASGNKMATPIKNNYGWLYTEDVNPVNDELSFKSATSYFVFTAAEGGFTISQPDGRYLYMTGTYNNFNVTESASEAGTIFTVAPNADGTFTITNTAMGKTIQYDPQYGSFGAYPDMRGVLPVLYEEVAAE